MIKYETIIVTIKVVVTISIGSWICCHYSGVWMDEKSKWSLYSSFMGVELGLNMSLLFRRMRDGLSERFKGYVVKRLSRIAVLNTTGILTERHLYFLSQYGYVLYGRFRNATQLPALLLVGIALAFSALICCVLLFGISAKYEHFIFVLGLPSFMYYLFLAHIYCDVVVQMDAICIDVESQAQSNVDMKVVLPEISAL